MRTLKFAFRMLLRPVPVVKPMELVDLAVPDPTPGSQSCNQAGDCDAVFSYAMFRDIEKDNNGVFTGVVAHRAFGTNLAYKGQTSSSEGMLVSGSYFPTLGLQPALGRLIDTNDDKAIGEGHIAVLSHDYCQSSMHDEAKKPLAMLFGVTAVVPSIALFAAALSLLTGILFGLFPALQTTRPDLASTLKGASGQPSGRAEVRVVQTALEKDRTWRAMGALLQRLHGLQGELLYALTLNDAAAAIR